MPFIPRQVKPPARQAITCKLPAETATLLKQYAEFLDSTQDYVVSEMLLVGFHRDKEFQAWLAAKPAGNPLSVPAARPADRPRS